MRLHAKEKPAEDGSVAVTATAPTTPSAATTAPAPAPATAEPAPAVPAGEAVSASPAPQTAVTSEAVKSPQRMAEEVSLSSSPLPSSQIQLAGDAAAPVDLSCSCWKDGRDGEGDISLPCHHSRGAPSSGIPGIGQSLPHSESPLFNPRYCIVFLTAALVSPLQFAACVAEQPTADVHQHLQRLRDSEFTWTPQDTAVGVYCFFLS